tara:strand:+ start:42 stop:839 length:798 start_codon:yes stop_codon:yes gene_type:complete
METKLENKTVLLTGLPRTGSTLLQNLLAQNTNFHVESNSALYRVMLDNKHCCEKVAIEQLTGSGKQVSFKQELLKSIPKIYYPNVEGKIILEKSRDWAFINGLNMAREYIQKDIKSIVMVRPLEEIVASLVRVANENNQEVSYEDFLHPAAASGALVMGSFHATYAASKTKDPSLLFVSYNDLVKNTQQTLSRIYSHIEVKKFTHDTQKVDQVVFEDDESIGISGMHTIRPKISVQENKVILPEWVRKYCKSLTHQLFSEIDKEP